MSMQSLDTENEVTNLEFAKDAVVAGLTSLVPSDSARYHLFWFRHTHEGDDTENAGEFLLIVIC